MHVDALYEYPLKSGAARPRDEVEVTLRGFARDRRWMLVDAQGRFLTGRKLPRLVCVHAEHEGDTLTLSCAKHLTVSARVDEGPSRAPVEIWGDRVDARVGYATADAWLRSVLGEDVRLAHLDDASHRPVDPRYARAGDEVSFADGFPVLVLGTASMAALNTRIGRTLPIARFRPNLVVATTRPHEEDDWKRIRVDNIEFELVKPCVRCVFTTVDSEHGTFDPSGEPLATLKTYRRGERGITFGMNAIARGTGRLHRGASVQVLE
jgi:hypothetical protein